MNNIILIEDQAVFARHYIEEAASNNLSVTHKKSFDGLKELLPKLEHKYAAVILDIKCLLKDDQEIEDAGFIATAISYLDQNVKGFPRFILTGDDKEFESLGRYYKDEKLFLKTPQGLEKLFEELAYVVAHSEELKIKRTYPEVFEVFQSGLMNNVAEALLLKIIKEGLSVQNFPEFKGVLADIRSFQETIYKAIRDKNNAIVPQNMFRSNGMIKFNDLMKHLSGNPPRPGGNTTTTVYQNNTIHNLANAIYWSCGEYIHEDPHRDYFVSINTIKSLVYGLLEIILWSKRYLE